MQYDLVKSPSPFRFIPFKMLPSVFRIWGIQELGIQLSGETYLACVTSWVQAPGEQKEKKRKKKRNKTKQNKGHPHCSQLPCFSPPILHPFTLAFSWSLPKYLLPPPPWTACSLPKSPLLSISVPCSAFRVASLGSSS